MGTKGMFSSSSRSLLLPLLVLLQGLNLACAIESSSSSSSLRRARVDYEQPEHVMDRVEQEALYEVMESLLNDSSQWRANHPHPCSSYHPWPGLECQQLDTGGGDYLLHVTKIDLVGSNPGSACKRNASLSPALFRLLHLRTLIIMGCFVGADTGIPTSLDKLAASLTVLTLRGNQALTGPIPRELSGLAKLEILSLSQNGLQGNVPAELGGLAKLQNLDLSYNALSDAIPGELGRLQGLSILDLSNNKLRGRIPASLGRMLQLKKLDLSNNALEGAVPAALGSLSSLQFLALDRNRLSGGIPMEIQRLANLQSLLLQDNPMRASVPDFWGSLGRVSQLRLSNSGYTGTIPGSIVLLKNLTELALDRNLLTGPIPENLESLPNIYHLNLSNNLLSGAMPFTPGFCSRLGANLDLHGNNELCSSGVTRSDLKSCATSQSLTRSSSQRNVVDRAAATLLLVFYLVRTLVLG